MSLINHSFTVILPKNSDGINTVESHPILVVNQLGGEVVDIFSDEAGTPETNPVFSDADGVVEFWVEPGIYMIANSNSETIFLGGKRRLSPNTVEDMQNSKHLRVGDLVKPKKYGEPPAAIGDLYFKLGANATNFRNTYFGGQFGTLNSDISISVGNTITFSFTANNSNPFLVNFIESSDGVNFIGYDNFNNASFVGYTATLNGLPINNGDPLPFSSAARYPIGGARLTHTIILTATTSTDVRFIGTSGIGQPIYDVTIATDSQTWVYPINSLTITNPDSNGSGNNLVLSGNNFWVDYPVMFNTGTGDTTNTAPYFNIESKDFDQVSNNFTYNAASMRKDEAGGALNTAGSSHWFGSALENIYIAYQDGFTLEITTKFVSFASSNGFACNVVCASSNLPGHSLWMLGFDNYDSGGSLKPAFSLLKRNVIYDRIGDYANNVADLRGDVAVTNNIYHLMFTIRPSNNSVEFWINGVSVGSTTLSQSVFDDWAYGSGVAGGLQDVLAGNHPTRFNVGARLVDGAWRGGQDCHIQDLKVHLLEADSEFAKRQAEEANYT